MARSGGTWNKGHGPPSKFQPGQSGNPTGRRKASVDAVEMARALTPKAFEALDRALGDPERAVHAAQVILDRGWGRPPQAVYAQVNAGVYVGGIDAPPRESLGEWMERRRRDLAALDGPPQSLPPARTGEHVQPPASPNGEAAALAEQSERAAERTAPQPRAFGSNAANSAGPPRGVDPSPACEMTEQQRDWLRIRRRELGIEPDDVHPNPAWKLQR